MFNLGELREVLEVHREVKFTDKKTGMTSKEYKKLYKLRCKKKVQSSNEYLSANRKAKTQTIKFLINSRRDIYLNDIVIYKNEQYNIKHISPYNNGYVDLICEVKRWY